MEANPEYKEKKTNFFLVYGLRQQEGLGVEMIIQQPKGSKSQEILKYDFENKNISIPHFDNARFFQLTLSLCEKIENKKLQVFLKQKDKLREISSYQIGITQMENILEPKVYQEYDKTRKFTGEANIFIFDLALQSKSNSEVSKSSIQHFLIQSFCFIVGMIETNRLDLLEDFIPQYQNQYQKHESISNLTLAKFSDFIIKFLEKKEKSPGKEKYDIEFAITCLLGLLPQIDVSALRLNLNQLRSIIRTFQVNINKLLCLELNSKVSITVLKGIALIFVLEEAERSQPTYTHLLNDISRNQDLLNYLLQLFLDYALISKVSIRPESFEKLLNLNRDLFKLYPNFLKLVQSLGDFVKMAGGFALSHLQNEDPLNDGEFYVEKIDLLYPSKTEVKHDYYTFESKMYVFPDQLSNTQIKIFENVKKELTSKLKKYLEHSQVTPGSLSLESLSSFFHEIFHVRDYFADIFKHNQELHQLIQGALYEARITDIDSLKLLFNIFIKYKNPQLLSKVNELKYLTEKLSSQEFDNRNFALYINFFSLLMTRPDWSDSDFSKILPAWLKNTLVPYRDYLIKYLDELYKLFGYSELDTKKKTIFLKEVLPNFTFSKFQQEIESILFNVKTREILETYIPFAKDKLQKEGWAKLHLKSDENPLLYLQVLLGKLGNSKLASSLIDFCMLQLPSLQRDDILRGLFERANHETLIYLILNEKVFHGSYIRKNVNRLCCEILNDTENLELQLKWIFAIENLQAESRENLYTQIHAVVLENNLISRNNNSKLDMPGLVGKYRWLLDGKIALIANLNDFINIFCSGTRDISLHLEKLGRLNENKENKKLRDLDCQPDFSDFQPYAQKLSPFKKSSSFFFCLNKYLEEKNIPVFGCLEKLSYTLEFLGIFQENLKNLLKSESTTIEQMRKLFVNFENIEDEVEILSEFLNQQQCDYLRDILYCLKNQQMIKRVCKGLKICVEYFDLSRELQDVIEDGVSLSQNTFIKILCIINKMINSLASEEGRLRCFEILAEFEDSEELIEFIFARNRVEVDLMKEIVSDDKESNFTQLIFDFAIFWDYIMKLEEVKKFKDRQIKYIFARIKQLFSIKDYDQIIENTRSGKQNLEKIQDLYLEITDKEEAKKKQIFKVVDESHITFIKTNKEFDVQVRSVTKKADKESVQTFKVAEIYELRNRANLIVFTEQKKSDIQEAQVYDEEDLEKFKAFCSMTDTIQEIILTLNSLKANGYPRIFHLKVDNCDTSIGKTDFMCEQNRFENLLVLRNQLTEISSKWNQVVMDSYQKHYDLTYFTGRDFWKVERALVDPENQTHSRGLHLLKYLGRGVRKVPLDQSKTPEERLDALGEALSHLTNLGEEPQPKNKEYTSFVFEVNEKVMMKSLLSLYMKFENSLPSSSQILVCDRSLSWNILQAFAYRCFFSPNSQIFCLIQPERLIFSLQDRFIDLLKQLINKRPAQTFHLAFITTNMFNHLIVSLTAQNHTKILKTDDLIGDAEFKDQVRKSTSRCRKVTSKFTGLGKTAWIKNFIKNNDLKYSKVPISGAVNPIKIGQMIFEVLSQKKPALYITLGSILDHDKSLLNEILFSLVVLRSFSCSKNVIELPQDLEIIIEIESSYFEDLVDEIEILGYLHTQYIPEMEWDKLHYLSPKVRFVCNYLRAIKNKVLGHNDLTEDDLKGIALSKDECLQLLKERFSLNHEIVLSSFTQLNIYINVLYSFFKSFSQSGFFMFSVLSKKFNPKEILSFFSKDETVMEMRLNLIEALILAVDQFTSKSVHKVRSGQESSLKSLKNQPNKANESLVGNAVISWENSQPFTVVFTQDNIPIFIYKNLKDVPSTLKKGIQVQYAMEKQVSRKGGDNELIGYDDYSPLMLFKKLASLTNSFYSKNVCLKCFRKYDRETKLCKVCKDKLLINDGNSDQFIKRISDESAKDYVLTTDNFIKMLLIFTRVEQKLPVLILGETGCGKTCLIRYICSRMLDCEFYSFSIHAGVDDNFIIKEMSELIKQAQSILSRKLWIFFDEFNTTSSIGLIKEIICERTLLGKELPENMVFLGACNPWRLRNPNAFAQDVGIKRTKAQKMHINSKLLYTVYPLPETMIEYIWDYGILDKNTERKYIEAMFSTLTAGSLTLKDDIVTLVCNTHLILRSWEDVSSVSLRDAARFKTLFVWFLTSLTKRYDEKILKNLPSQAAVLALVHCYYHRIACEKKRQELLTKLEPLLAKLAMKKEDVETLIYQEELDFIKRMENIPAGIASNKALRENIFALIVCICNKIPLFICGKPGCSKSLAIQLVLDNLRGKKSGNWYFKTLPELIPIFYQGSESCTSESVLNVFERAEKYLYINTRSKEILPVIVFDEIGLAEISENNPLKILHNKLEMENIRVGFVGISNWRLDASKMNRAVYLARPDPSVEELAMTAKEICRAARQHSEISQSIIECLSKAYCNLRENLKGGDEEDMFGLRDFYFLIKQIKLDLDKVEEILFYDTDKSHLYSIVQKNLKRNFSGIEKAYRFLWKQFCLTLNLSDEIYKKKEPSTTELLLSNLKEKNGRYLMIITQNDSITEYVEKIIQNQTVVPILAKESASKKLKSKNLIKTLVGSQLQEDMSHYSYGFRVLSDIILYMEKGYTLIFKKIEKIYSNLYDLFNQNFSTNSENGKKLLGQSPSANVDSGKKFCKVALDASYNPKREVHPNFHCVILMTEEDVKRADPPFLNRFEKYRLNFEDIISKECLSVQQRLIEWTHLVLQGQSKEVVNPQLIFVNYSSEYLFSLVLKNNDELMAENGNSDKDLLFNQCQHDLIQTATFDFPIRVSLNIHKEDEKNRLLQIYYKEKPQSFEGYCEQIIKNNIKKSVIYTYTQIWESIKYNSAINIKEFRLRNFKSELELLNEIKKTPFATSALLVIRVDIIEEGHHLLFLKHILDDLQNNQTLSSEPHIVILIHSQRHNINNIQNYTLFQEWQTVMFDRLNEPYYLPLEFLVDPSFPKLTSSKLMPSLNTIFESLFDKCLSRVKYNVSNKDHKIINERRNKILKILLKEDSPFPKLIQKKINTMILGNMASKVNYSDWRTYIFDHSGIKVTAASTLKLVKKVILEYYEGFLMKILYRLEKDYLLDACCSAIEMQDKFLIELWCDNFTKISSNINDRIDDEFVEINADFGLLFPFSYYENPKIQELQEINEEILESEEEPQDCRKSTEKLFDRSFFGRAFYKLIFADETHFNSYFSDQLALYLKKNKFTVKLEILWSIIESLFSNPEDQLEYFLSQSAEIRTVLDISQALLTLEGGETILLKSLNGFINLDKDHIIADQLPERILILKEGKYYIMKRNQFSVSEIIAFNPKDIQPCEIENPFYCVMFGNIIQEICNITELLKMNNISRIKASFQIIEENLIQFLNSAKGEIHVESFESFQSWIDIIHFIETCERNPNEKFIRISEWVQSFSNEAPKLVLSCNFIQKFITYLRTETDFATLSSQTDRKKKFLKLKSQLFKHLVSGPGDDVFTEPLQLIEEDHQLWKFSDKIFYLLDGYIGFSDSVCNGLEQGESDIKNLPDKALVMLSNKAVNTSRQAVNSGALRKVENTLRADFEEHYVSFLRDWFRNFEKNLYSLQRAVKAQNILDIPLLGVISQLKVYLDFYCQILEENEGHRNLEFIKEIDDLLKSTVDDLPIIPFYAMNVLKQKYNKSTAGLISSYQNRTVGWITKILKNYPGEDPNKNFNFIFFCLDLPEFAETESLLNNMPLDKKKMIEFVSYSKRGQQSSALLRCIYAWFLRFYTKYWIENNVTGTHKAFIDIIQKYQKELASSVGDLGSKLIILLVDNFKKNSYFSLHPKMSLEDVLQRVVALNVLICFISQQFSDSNLSAIFFDKKQFQKNLASHLSNQHLIGQYADKTEIIPQRNNCYRFDFSEEGERLSTNSSPSYLGRGLTFVFKEDTRDDFSSYSNRMSMNSENAKFSLIGEKGYIINPTESNIKMQSKSDMRPITYRTLHFLLHTALFTLCQLDFISHKELSQITKGKKSPEESLDYFKSHFEQDYMLINDLIGRDIESQYFWICQVVSNCQTLENSNFDTKDMMGLNKFERQFEDKIVLSSLDSLNVAQIQLTKDFTLINKDDLLVLAKYLSYVKPHSFKDFCFQFQLQNFNSGNYSLLTFVLENYEELSSISHLYEIVDFSNYLRDKFDYRITRKEAQNKTIKSLFNDDELIESKFRRFKKAWDQITIKKIFIRRLEYNFKQVRDNDTLDSFLPNVRGKGTGLFFIGIMAALADLQNKFIQQTRKLYSNSNNLIHLDKEPPIIIQTVKQQDLIMINEEIIKDKISQNGYINSRENRLRAEVIYDFEEVEKKLYLLANGKKMLNTQSFVQVNYQFEFYSEANSIITDIRRRTPQNSLTRDMKLQLKSLIEWLSSSHLSEYLGSLNYIFTYLSNQEEDGNRSIRDFCKACIHKSNFLNSFLSKDAFSKIQLKYIIDFYELLEEATFDKVLEDNLHAKYNGTFTDSELTNITNIFQEDMGLQTLMLKDKYLEIETLMPVLKRIIIRVLDVHNDLGNDRLTDYIMRHDMWSYNSYPKIFRIKLRGDIKLKHTYMILKSLRSQLHIAQFAARNPLSIQSHPRVIH